MNTRLGIRGLATRITFAARHLAGAQNADKPAAPPLLSPVRPRWLVLLVVAVGPSGGNWADTFDLDFSVAR